MSSIKPGLQTADQEAVPSEIKLKISLIGIYASLALILLALADTRRAFLALPYFIETKWASLSVYHFVLFGMGTILLFTCFSQLRAAEHTLDSQKLQKAAKSALWVLFGLLVFDLLVFYRGVAAQRIAVAGSMSSPVAGMIPATAELIPYNSAGLMRPVAMTVNYIAAVWHATIIGLMLASLSIVGLTKTVSGKLAGASHLKSVTVGSIWALPQPFCSCCASPVAAGLIKGGSPISSALSFLVASPMLNITALFLAVMLLPLDYAVLRIGAGLLLAVPISYALARIIDKFVLVKEEEADRPEKHPGKVMSFFYSTFNRYCDTFHVERLLGDGNMDSPSAAMKAVGKTFVRMIKLIVPILVIGAFAASLLTLWLSPYVSNNVLGVILAAGIGVLLMIATWTEIPVATVMLSAGLTGPAAAMLIVLPAVSLPCLMILGGSIRNFKVAAMLGFVVFALGSIAGIAFI